MHFVGISGIGMSALARILDEGVATPGLALLAQAVAEAPDVEGLLLLIKLQTDPTCDPGDNWR